MNDESIIPNLSLSTPDGSKVFMPQIGLGTYKFKKGSGECKDAILDALEIGYRHIDTAFIYGGELTEKEVGEALQVTTVPRADIFLTTKQWRAYHGYEATKKCLEKSLRRLQTNYVDLYLIHWPGPNNYRNDNDALLDIQKLRSETCKFKNTPATGLQNIKISPTPFFFPFSFLQTLRESNGRFLL